MKRREIFKFTWPPSVNRIWRKFRGRMVLSPEAERWKSLNRALNPVKQSHSFGAARLSVSFTLYPPDKKKRDIDNFTKLAIDHLQQCAVFDDDSQIDRLAVARGEVRKGGEISITIEEV